MKSEEAKCSCQAKREGGNRTMARSGRQGEVDPEAGKGVAR